MTEYRWDAGKDKHLKATRDIGFAEILTAIEAGQQLADTVHPDPRRYSHQRILVIEVRHYAYVVPYVPMGDVYYLKTIIPSRKATKRYLKGE